MKKETIQESTRKSYLLAAAFLAGFEYAPAWHLLEIEEPKFLITSVALSAMLFCGCSFIALFSKRRAYLFLGYIFTHLGSVLLVSNSKLRQFTIISGNVDHELLLTILFFESLFTIYST